jgi:MEDS: MEthanogen/methylotroph, DcmR Sensory domain
MLEKMTVYTSPDANTGAGDPDRFKSAIFWGEISPCEHLVQIYKDDDVFLDALEGFVAGGIKKGDGVIVIATPAHLAVLEHRMLSKRLDPGSAAARDQYIALDAEQALSNFMVDGWPNDRRFTSFVTDLVSRAGKDGDASRRVRAFGEMVAVLWSRGNFTATIRLEYLWHDFCQKNAFCLFCAYPRACFTQDAEASIQQICAAHSSVVPG